MHFNPQESREARAETSAQIVSPAAASTLSQEHAISPALSDPRGSQPMSGRGADIGQLFPVAPSGVVGTPIRPRRAIPRSVLFEILERKPQSIIDRLSTANDSASLNPLDRDVRGMEALAMIIGGSVFLLGLFWSFLR